VKTNHIKHACHYLEKPWSVNAVWVLDKGGEKKKHQAHWLMLLDTTRLLKE
jgi:hypothetical protein